MMISNNTKIISTLALTVIFLLVSQRAMATNVIMETPLGNFEVELFDDETPVTVANFLKYVNGGAYQNSFIHRSIPGFVIQGGGYTFTDGMYGAVPTDDPIHNETSISNTRGTIRSSSAS